MTILYTIANIKIISVWRTTRKVIAFQPEKRLENIQERCSMIIKKVNRRGQKTRGKCAKKVAENCQETCLIIAGKVTRRDQRSGQTPPEKGGQSSLEVVGGVAPKATSYWRPTLLFSKVIIPCKKIKERMF